MINDIALALLFLLMYCLGWRNGRAERTAARRSHEAFLPNGQLAEYRYDGITRPPGNTIWVEEQSASKNPDHPHIHPRRDD